MKFWTVFLATVLADKSLPVPKVNVNLDLEPQLRWPDAFSQIDDTTLERYCTGMTRVIEIYRLDKRLGKLIKKFIPEIKDAIPSEYLAEIDGVYEAVNSHCDMPFLSPRSEGINLIYALNLVYEIEAFQLPWQREVASQACTSIMAWSKVEGHAIAGRNMDFEPQTQGRRRL